MPNTECPRCGAQHSDACTTTSGRDHAARVRVIIGRPTDRDRRALARWDQEGTTSCS